jgi:CxxC motif-containing protein (DUF1111 family)
VGTLTLFDAGRVQFQDEETVATGLGPLFNFVSCAGCHSQPALGGTSPTPNPLLRVVGDLGFTANTVPSFLTATGPVREARFVHNTDGTRDGQVHQLFTIAGHADAPGCLLPQENFAAQQARNNVVFRIPTPVFGSGLIEQIGETEILDGAAVLQGVKKALGITGHPNRSPDDGSIMRFGWKAQVKSLLAFTGQAYLGEIGISNELFPNEHVDTTCQFAPVPNDTTMAGAPDLATGLSGTLLLAQFMRNLAPPTSSPDTPGGAAMIAQGQQAFTSVGCALCHTPSFTTGQTTNPALAQQTVALFSDLLVHDMGAGLADGITQGQAGDREFRTAPLWGVGQRLFFLHDGRATDLPTAIVAHQSAGSEANQVIANFLLLTPAQQQALLAFLRSL